MSTLIEYKIEVKHKGKKGELAWIVAEPEFIFCADSLSITSNAAASNATSVERIVFSGRDQGLRGWNKKRPMEAPDGYWPTVQATDQIKFLVKFNKACTWRARLRGKAVK